MESKIFIVIALFTSYIFWLVVFRVYFSENILYIFMLWNLFLALIPIFIIQFYTLLQKFLKKINKFISILIFWLFFLFYPNIPYLITDLMHLPEWFRSFPVWYDNVLLFSFTFLWVLIWYFSLNFWQNLLEKIHWKITSWFFVFFALLISSYWVFLWRYVRFNSWDIFSDFSYLFWNIYNTFFMEKMYLFTINFFIMSLFIYISLHLLFFDKNIKKIS